MNSFESEIMNNFGVKLRSRSKATRAHGQERPPEWSSQDMNRQQSMYPSYCERTRPQSMAPSMLNLSRFVYLPPAHEDRQHMSKLESCRPHIAGIDNWQLRYGQCQFRPGNGQWNYGLVTKPREQRKNGQKKKNDHIRRSQSFNQGKRIFLFIQN